MKKIIILYIFIFIASFFLQGFTYEAFINTSWIQLIGAVAGLFSGIGEAHDTRDLTEVQKAQAETQAKEAQTKILYGVTILIIFGFLLFNYYLSKDK